MKTLITILVVLALSSMVAQGFMFSPKNKTKSVCDPNPCKHKATCTINLKNEAVCNCTSGHHGKLCELKNACESSPCKHKGACKTDAKNQSIAICTCTDGYVGKFCESKNGCASKPCRKGNCTVDAKNATNYSCKCNPGFVGKNCDTADGCAKNPCKNGAKCKLDAKNKQFCECNSGWGSKVCDKRNCTIQQYKGKHFDKSSQKVFIDPSVKNKFDDLDGLAQLCKVKIHAIRSFVLHSNPKAVTLDTMDKSTNPHHYIGQALGFEIYDESGKLLCNDICLGKIPIPQAQAKCFIDGLHAIKWKWSILEPATVHTGFAVANLTPYNQLRELHQVGCRESKLF